MEAVAAPFTQFQGMSGALIVSLIAFTIVFSVLAGLSAIICVIRYVSNTLEAKKNATVVSAPTVSSSVAPVVEGGKDMRKIVAAISAALITQTGRTLNIISVTPLAGNCSPMNARWRAAGVADCLESRMGSRSW